jgi:hypothetical protein
VLTHIAIAYVKTLRENTVLTKITVTIKGNGLLISGSGPGGMRLQREVEDEWDMAPELWHMR